MIPVLPPFRRALAAVTLMAAAGCSTSSSGPTTPIGYLRLVHASPVLPSLDVTLGGTSVVTAFAFGTNSGYYQTAASTSQLVARPAGTTLAATTDTAVAVPADSARTVIFTGTQAAPRTLILSDTLQAATGGQVQLRFVHAITGIGAVDVYLTPIGTARSTTPAVAGLTYTARSPYTLQAPGIADLLVTAAGDTTTKIYARPAISLGSGGIGTIVLTASGQAGAPGSAIFLADQ